MNFVLHGHAVSGGITVGYAHLVSTARLEVAHYEVAPDAIEAEVRRFDAGMQAAQQELLDLKAHIPADSPPEFAAFLDLHRMILNDSALAQAPREMIRQRRANAEWALVQQMERLVERFDEIDDPYLRERAIEALDLGLDVLGRHLVVRHLEARGRHQVRIADRDPGGDRVPVQNKIHSPSPNLSAISCSRAASAWSASAPSASMVTVEPLPAASIITPMMLFAFTRRLLRVSQISHA